MKDNKSDNWGCGCFLAIWWWFPCCAGLFVAICERDIALFVIFALFIIVSIAYYVKWVTDDRKEAEIEYKKQQEEEMLERKQEEDAKRLEEEREAKISDLTRRPLKTLSIDELSLLGSEFGDDEAGKEKFFRDAIWAGCQYATELLIQQAEKRNQRLTPSETISHCDEINDLVPNGMCYYRKGLALKELRRQTDDTIAALETAISVDDTARSNVAKLSSSAREHIAKLLPSLRKKARKEHIEKDGQYNLVKTGIEYEDFVCGIIRRMGYACKKTPATDQGVDIVVSLKNGHNLAVQCKFLSVPVSNSAVQEVVAGKALYKCRYACVVGKSGYTKAAIELATVNNVRLIRHDEIYDCITAFEKM